MKVVVLVLVFSFGYAMGAHHGGHYGYRGYGHAGMMRGGYEQQGYGGMMMQGREGNVDYRVYGGAAAAALDEGNAVYFNSTASAPAQGVRVQTIQVSTTTTQQ